MATIKREKPNYLTIGAFLFIGLVLIIVSVVFADKLVYKIKGGYPLYIMFNNVDGLLVGSKLKIGSGKEIGQVDKIDVDGSTLILTLVVEKKYKINQDANFQIFSSSLVGGKFIEVVNYTGKAPHFEPKTSIKGIDPFSINQVFSLLGSFMSGDSAGGLGDNVNGIFSSITTTANTIARIVEDNQTNVDVAMENLASASIKLNSLANSLDRKLRLLSDKDFDKIINDLEISLSELSLFIKAVNAADAPLSVLKDPAINHSIRTIVTNLEDTTERVKKKPSLLFRS